MEVDFEGFSIREYTRKIRSVEVRKCWPFSGEATEDLIHSLLPPITVAKFRWWSNELASLLAKSPVAADDSDPVFRRKATKAKPKPCKKCSIVENLSVAPQIQLPHREEDDSDVIIGSKRKRTQKLVAQNKIKSKNSKDSGDRKVANKVSKCKEQACMKMDDGNKESSLGVIMSLRRKKAETISKEHDTEFPNPGILKAKRKLCSVRSDDKSKMYAPQGERQVKLSRDQNGKLSQPKTNIASLELCCLEMNRLSLSSSKNMSNVETNDDLQLESGQQNKFQPAVSERRSRENPLTRERKGDVVAQHIQPFIPTSQPASADMHCLYQSPFDPLVLQWMQNSVLDRQEHVEEAVSGFHHVEECCTSLDPPSLGTTGSSSRFAENDLLRRHVVDSTKATLAKDGVVHHEKRYNYFPARLGIDETFTEDNEGECIFQTLHSPVSIRSPRSHSIKQSTKQDGLSENLNSRNMFENSDGLRLHNSQEIMRIMGKDVSVDTSYSDIVKIRERLIATSDASIDSSFLGNSTAPLDMNWNRALLQDIAKDLFRRFCEPQHVVLLDSEFPPVVLNPCCSLESFSPTDNYLISFHESSLVQHQQNSFTFSQQEQLLPFPSNHNNVGIGLPCADSTTLSQVPPWPQSSFEKSCFRNV